MASEDQFAALRPVPVPDHPAVVRQAAGMGEQAPHWDGRPGIRQPLHIVRRRGHPARWSPHRTSCMTASAVMCLPTDPMWNSVRSVTGTRNGSEAYTRRSRSRWPDRPRTTVTAAPGNGVYAASSAALRPGRRGPGEWSQGSSSGPAETIAGGAAREHAECFRGPARRCPRAACGRQRRSAAKAMRACKQRRLVRCPVVCVPWRGRACDKAVARAIKSSLPACRFPIRFTQQ
jgi:hypothetical protein